jgi:hypothetical protein
MSNIDKIRELLSKIPFRPIQANTSNIQEVQALYQKRKEK